jgi:hypothetical protein
MFSSTTLTALINAGWNVEYDFDPQEFQEILKKEGYEYFELADKFLRKYGNLHIDMIHPHNVTLRNIFHFDAAIAAVHTPYERTIHYESLVQRKLCVVGEKGIMAILIDENGWIYGEYDVFLLIGRSPEEGIENLCQIKIIEEIQ